MIFKWFACLFTNNFEKELTIYVWDKFFVDGNKVIYQMGLAVIYAIQDRILKLSEYIDLYQFFEFEIRNIATFEVVIKIINSGQCKVTYSMLNNIRKKILSENPKLTIFKFATHIDQKHCYLSKLSYNLDLNEVSNDNWKSKRIVIKKDLVECNTNWGMCKFDHTYKNKIIEFFRFRVKEKPIIIENYFSNDFSSHSNMINQFTNSYNSADNGSKHEENHNHNKNKNLSKHRNSVNKEINDLIDFDQLLVERNPHYCNIPKFQSKLIKSLESDQFEKIFFHDSITNTNVIIEHICHKLMNDFVKLVLNSVD